MSIPLKMFLKLIIPLVFIFVIEFTLEVLRGYRLPIAYLHLLKYPFGAGYIIYFLWLNNGDKKVFYSIVISILMITIGFVSTRFHWVGGGIELLLGFVMLFISYLVRFLKKRNNSTLNSVKLALVTSICFFSIARELHYAPIHYWVYLHFGIYLSYFISLLIYFYETAYLQRGKSVVSEPL